MGFLTVAAGIYSSGSQEEAFNLTDVTSGNSGNDGSFAHFHPSNGFIAVCGNSASKQIAIWSWNGTDTIAEVETVNLGVDSYGCCWHPNGDYLAVGLYTTTGAVKIYSWNGSNTLTEVESINITNGSGDVQWSPDGNFLVVTNYNTAASIKVYSWNGYDTLTEVESLNTGVASYYCGWSSSGKYLYVGSPLTNKQICVYSWNGSDTLTEVASYSLAALTYKYGQGACWYSDDSYLFVATPDTTKSIHVFAFNGSSLTHKQTVNTGFFGRRVEIVGDKFVIAGLYQSSVASNSYLRGYEFDSTAETLTEKDTLSYTADGIQDIDFNVTGETLALPMRDETNITVRVVDSGLSAFNKIFELSVSADINSGGDAWPCDWHSNGNYIAYAGNMTGKQVCVASWNGSDTLTEVETVNPAGTCGGLHWHPSTEHLAVVEGGDATNSIVIYSWNGSDTLTNVAHAGTTSGMASVHWHPDGDYVAVGTYNTAKSIIIYSWNGSDTLAEVESVNTGAAEYGVRWSADGDYLAVAGNESAKDLKVYGWNGTDTLTFKDSHNFGTTGNGYSPRWKSDGTYVFACAQYTSDHQVFAFTFNGTTLTEKATLDFAKSVRGLDIHDDKYISLGMDWNTAAATNECLKIYEYDFDCDAFIMKEGYTVNARGCNIGDFSNNGEYIAAPMLTDSASKTLRVIKLFQ